MNPELDWDWFEDCLRHTSWQELSPEAKEKIREHFTEESYEAARKQLLRSWQLLSEDAQNQPALPPLRKSGAKPLPFLGMAAGFLLILGLAWMLWPKKEPKVLSYAPDSSNETPVPKQPAHPEENQAEVSETLLTQQADENQAFAMEQERDKVSSTPEDSDARTEASSLDLNSEQDNYSPFGSGASASQYGNNEALASSPQSNTATSASEDSAPIPITHSKESLEESSDLSKVSRKGKKQKARVPVYSSNEEAESGNGAFLSQQATAQCDTFWRADTLWVRFGSKQKPDSLIFLHKIPPSWKKRKP